MKQNSAPKCITLTIMLVLNLLSTINLQADSLPAGSYKDSCYNCTYQNGTLACQCCDSPDRQDWDTCQAFDDKGKLDHIRPHPTSVNKLPGITCSSYKNDNGKLGCEKASPDAVKIKQ